MAPTVVPTSQVWRAAATILGQGRGNFRDPFPIERHLHNHLAGELHSRSSEIKFDCRVSAKAAQTAVKISARTLEQQLANESEHGIAKILMQWRHRVGLDPAAKAISHHQVIAGAQLFDKRHQVHKVV